MLGIFPVEYLHVRDFSSQKSACYGFFLKKREKIHNMQIFDWKNP